MSQLSAKMAIDMFDIALQEAINKDIYDQETGGTFRDHCLLVACCAEIIASKTPEVNPQSAYVLGLLHDYGKMLKKEEGPNSFHGLVGYTYMKQRGLDIVANICITHSFPESGFLEEEYASINKDDLAVVKKILKTELYNEYSKIVQLSDLLTYVYKYATLKERMIFIKDKYSIPLKHIKKKYREAIKLKKYFDDKCGVDIYKLLGIKE